MPEPDQLPIVSTGVLSFLLGDELLLFLPHAHALFRLNPSAALIWCCCEERLDRAAITRELTQTFQLSPGQAQQDLDTTLSEWTRRGLLGRTDAPSAAADSASCEEEEDIPAPHTRIRSFPAERRYRMFGTVFRLRFSRAELAPFAESAFAHLAVPPDCPCDVCFELQHDPRGFILLCDDQPIGWCRSEQELAPLLHGQVVAESYRRADCLIAFHAAAVSNGAQCLVFPALSGSGKSTLTAALLASGYRYCTDELVLLQADSHQVQCIDAGLGIKPGAWKVLQAFYPHMEALPVHLRLDGQQVRYLLPEAQQLSGGTTRHPVRALVFPVYQADSETRLQRLTPADALCRLTDAGTDMEDELDSTSVTELVDWIADMESYELRYSRLEEAIARVRTLLP